MSLISSSRYSTPKAPISEPVDSFQISPDVLASISSMSDSPVRVVWILRLSTSVGEFCDGLTKLYTPRATSCDCSVAEM